VAERSEAILARWERFWFGEASLVRLALFRIVLLAAAFDGVWVVRKAIFQHAQGVDAAFARIGWRPIYAFELLGLGPAGPAAARWIWGVLLVAITLGILGLCTRLACAVVALFSFYWIGSEYSFGKPHHTCVALMFGLFALPLAPVGARLSLDSLLRRLRAARRGGDPLAVPERAPWAALPIRLTQITVALGYFFSGASKLAISGPTWANGYTLMGIMVEYRSPWSEHFYESQPLLVLLSLGLLAGQVGFPLVFLGTPWRWVFVPIAVLFHVMAMQTMGTGTFLTLWLALSCFVALERVPEFLARTVGSGPWWRRAAVALAFGAVAWGTVLVYASRKPLWLPWLLLPVAFTLLLAALPRLLPALELVYDPSVPGSRRAVAWLAACDWARRLRLRAASPGDRGLTLILPGGREQRGAAALASVVARVPVAPLLVPFVARCFRRQTRS
jgi:hypothetical protein